MFAMFFHIEASDVPFTKHQSFIDETSMNHQYNNDEEIATFTCFMAEFKAVKLRILQISSFPIKSNKNICQEVDLTGKTAMI